MKKIIYWSVVLCLLLSGCGQAAAPTAPTMEPPFVQEQPTLSATEPTEEAEILAYRRDVVEAEMRRCMSALWTPAEDIT